MGNSIRRMPYASSRIRWVIKGVSGIWSIPAMVLMFSMVGFSGLAREAGLDWLHATFMTLIVWAMPAQLILIGAITAGLSLPGAALIVCLSSVRLMPMVVVLISEMRSSKDSQIKLVSLSHFVVVTSWVCSMQKFGEIPKEYRTDYYAGFAVTLALANAVVVALASNVMGALPPFVSGALAFVTPVYFVMSLYGSARDSGGKYALLAGICLLPVAHATVPKFDILIAGVVGGMVAFIAGHWRLVAARKSGEGEND